MDSRFCGSDTSSGLREFLEVLFSHQKPPVGGPEVFDGNYIRRCDSLNAVAIIELVSYRAEAIGFRFHVETVFAGIGGCRIDLHGMISINGADRAQALLISFQAGKALPAFGRRLPDMLLYFETLLHTSSLQPVASVLLMFYYTGNPLISYKNIIVLKIPDLGAGH
jgi:hypothetical protein